MSFRRTKVGAHFKPSLGKVVESYDRDQRVTESKAGENTKVLKGALKSLVSSDKTTKQPLVFPVPTCGPKRKGWWGRRKESWFGTVDGSKRVNVSSFNQSVWTYRNLNRKGEGIMHVGITYEVGSRMPKSACESQVIGPDQTIVEWEFLYGQNYRNTNMPGLCVWGDVRESSWAGSNLQGSHFRWVGPDGNTAKNLTRHGWRESDGGGRVMRLMDVDFDGCDLSDSKFYGVSFNDVSMRGAKLDGVEFKNIYAGWSASVADFTDSNVTEEQFDSFVKGGAGGRVVKRSDGSEDLKGSPLDSDVSGSELPYRISIRRYSPTEVSEVAGVDPEELSVLLWAGEIPYRSKVTDMVTDESFDAEKHYIPQWEVQRLAGI